MKKSEVLVRRYDADEGKVFDWKEPRFETNEKGEEVRQHLHARTLFLSPVDSIDNYIEVEELT